MHTPTSLHLLYLVALLVPDVLSQCASYGSDYVDGGTYCINTQSPDYFSFGTFFTGFQPSDSQGNITPILVDPNNNEYFCSDIPTTPDNTVYKSTCNVANNQVLKSSMYSGTWVIVIEGLTFAYQRSLNLIAGPPVVVTSTPTVSFTSTVTPTTTTLTTATVTNLSTLLPVTVTSPSATITKTYTAIAGPTTSVSTLWIVITSKSVLYSVTTTRVTVATACKTLSPIIDKILNFRPTKTPSPRKHRNKGREAEARRELIDLERRAALGRRDPDLCTTTVLASTNLPSVTVTSTAPVVTVPSIIYNTIISTVTPAPVTVYTGATVITVTTTKPGIVLIIPTIGYSTVKTTTTLIATITSIINIPPSGVACLKTR